MANGESPDYHTEIRDGISVNVCDACGQLRYCGDWMHCPHGSGLSFGEEPLEPYIDHNVDTNPVLITTRAQRRELMKKNGLDYRKKRTDLVSSGRVYVFQGGRR
jgi:hypothetical protein